MQPITPPERRLRFRSRPSPPFCLRFRAWTGTLLPQLRQLWSAPARQATAGTRSGGAWWQLTCCQKCGAATCSWIYCAPHHLRQRRFLFFFIATGSSQQENPLKCPWWESPGARVKVTAADANQPWLPYANAPSPRAPASKRDLFLSEPLINDCTGCFLLSVQKKSTGEPFPACLQAHPFCWGSWVEFKSPDQFLIRNVFLSVGQFPTNLRGLLR